MFEQFVGLMVSDCCSPWCPFLAIERTCLLYHAEQTCRLTKDQRDNTYGLQIIGSMKIASDKSTSTTTTTPSTTTTTTASVDFCVIAEDEKDKPTKAIVLATFAPHKHTPLNKRFCYVECKIGWYRLAGYTHLKLTCIPKGEKDDYGLLNVEDIKCAGVRFVLRGGLYVSCSFGCEVCHFCAHHALNVCSANVHR